MYIPSKSTESLKKDKLHLSIGEILLNKLFNWKRLRKSLGNFRTINLESHREMPVTNEECTTPKNPRVTPVPTPQELEQIQTTFCHIVQRQTAWLTPLFQNDTGQTRKAALDAVYVVPHLLKLVPLQKRKIEERLQIVLELDERERREKQDKIRKEWIKEYQIEEKIELTLKEAITSTKNDHIVILGEPGAGKTLLLWYVAWKISRNQGTSLGIEKRLLPVFIPLKCSRRCKMFKEFVFQYIKEHILPLPDAVLDYFLENNAFFLLFDSLDEVAEPERIHLSRQVEEFMAQYPRTRMMVMSRPAEYKSAPLMGAIPCFTLAEFNDEEMKEFLTKFSLELRGKKGETEEEVNNLVNVVKKTDLARNPLLLTMLVLIHRAGKKLPERRAELFQCAVETVVDTWENWNVHTGRKIPDREVVLALLEKAGFELYRKNRKKATRDEVRTWLKEVTCEEQGHPSTVDDSTWMLEGVTGLFVESEPGMYQFVHLTVQEYFAAQYIASGRGSHRIQEVMRQNLYSRHWREVFSLAAATAPPQQADLIFDSIMKVKNDFEEYIHSNLLFAGEMLGNRPKLNELRRDDIIDRLKSLTGPDYLDVVRIEALQALMEVRKAFQFDDKWVLESFDDKNWTIRSLAVRYVTIARAIDGEIKERILALVKDEEWRVRYLAVKYFTTVGADDTKIKKKVFELLKDEDPDVCFQAVDYFTSGEEDPEIKKKFFKLLEDEDLFIRYLALKYFTITGKNDPKIRKKFFKLLSDEKRYSRYLALKYFTTTGAEDPEIRREFFELLKDEDQRIRYQALEYFTTGSKDTDGKKFFELLKDEDQRIRYLALKYFTSTRADTDMKRRFLELLADKDPAVRQQVERYFTTTKVEDADLKKKFLELLDDEDPDVRYLAVEYLSTVSADTDIEKKFFELLSDKDWRIRYLAVEYLTTKGAKDTATQKKIFALLGDEDPDVRYRVVRYFTTIEAEDTEIKKKILELLKDEYSHVRYRAAEYLSTVGVKDTDIKKKIFELLTDEDSDVRFIAVRFFTTIGGKGTEMRKFFELLKDEDPDIRYLVLRYCMTVRAQNPETKTKFLELLIDDDPDVRSLAVRYFAVTGAQDAEIKKKIFELLADEAYSPFSGRKIQDIAVEYLCHHAREESREKAPILFKSHDEPTKRGAYNLMKALLTSVDLL